MRQVEGGHASCSLSNSSVLKPSRVALIFSFLQSSRNPYSVYNQVKFLKRHSSYILERAVLSSIYSIYMQVNYLGHYTLVRQLEGVLVASAPSRVVSVSSVTSRFCRLRSPAAFLSQLKHASYGETKLAQIMFTYELQRRLGHQGLDVKSPPPPAWSARPPSPPASAAWPSVTIIKDPLPLAAETRFVWGDQAGEDHVYMKTYMKTYMKIYIFTYALLGHQGLGREIPPSPPPTPQPPTPHPPLTQHTHHHPHPHPPLPPHTQHTHTPRFLAVLLTPPFSWEDQNWHRQGRI